MSAEETKPLEQGSGARGASGLVGRLTVLAFVVAVIGGECLIACLYLPSATATEVAAAEVPEAEPDEPEAVVDPVTQQEVDLGQYSLTVYQPTTNSTLLIDFHLYATIAIEPDPNREPGAPTKHEEEFARRFEKHKHRIRDQVGTIIRSAEMVDFADPSLGLIRRKILEKTNRTLGRPLLREVIFSEFSLIEQ